MRVRRRMRDETRRELRKLGARAEARGPATADDSGVAVADRPRARDQRPGRRPNDDKQIAAQLFLSEKTIESHIRNVFNKLGASSRVEVARAIERGGGARSAANGRRPPSRRAPVVQRVGTSGQA